jgi:hypothetical protein
MIRKSEYFEQTDKYLNSELTLPELKEFEIQLEIDSDLNEEVNLHLDVEQAMCEQDIISLRNTLNQIVQNQTVSASNENISVFDSFSFGLTEEFSSQKSSNAQFNPDDIFNFGHSFPKIHLYQHIIAGKENIHQFYKEQFETNSVSNEESGFSQFEEELFSDIQNALEENDIFDLRANLMQVAQSIPAHQYSAEEIEDYINNRMDSELKIQFEQELTNNSDLASEIRLITEIDLAGAESDIINLRASLNKIQRSEFQPSASIEELESYIHSELSNEELASFEAELASNQKLMDEIGLIKNIDLALSETDVMQLRNNLQNIASEIAANKQTERSFAGKFKAKRIVLSTVAASLILLLGITGILSRQSSQEDIYQKFYNKYEATGIVRSANLTANKTLSEALQKFENQDFNAAIDLFSEVINRDQNNMVGHFYTGVSLQETGKYQNAIKEYETVIIDKDNLFTEQAEWYIGLCYLQTNENKKAYQQFKKIAKNEGFYQQKAQSILSKIKYSE